jgi:hypothetical protein
MKFGEELSQAELNEIFYGKKPTVEAVFLDCEVTDPVASRAAGRKVTKMLTHVQLSCIREDTMITRPATKKDERDYPKEFAKYVAERDGLGHVETLHLKRGV